jgi:hypothetical protein
MQMMKATSEIIAKIAAVASSLSRNPMTVAAPSAMNHPIATLKSK